MPENISRVNVNTTSDAFNTKAMQLPADNWTPLNIASPGEPARNVDWSFRALSTTRSNSYDPYDAKIRFKGADGQQHEIVYQPQGRVQSFNTVNPQSYQFAAVSYDGVYRDPVSGGLLNVDGNTSSTMPRAEFEAGMSQAGRLFTALSASKDFQEPKISGTYVANEWATPHLASSTYSYRSVDTPAARAMTALAPSAP